MFNSLHRLWGRVTGSDGIRSRDGVEKFVTILGSHKYTGIGGIGRGGHSNKILEVGKRWKAAKPLDLHCRLRH